MPSLAPGVVQAPGVKLPAGTVVEAVTASPRVSEPLSPVTTAQQDLTTAGQRKINLIWEYTQAAIALTVVVANMAVGAMQGLGYASDRSFPIILSSSLFLVVGFYFSRTNHAAIGGVGPKPQQEEYRGR